MTDTPEIARIRWAVKNERFACNPAAMTGLLAYIDAQSAEIVRLNKIISDCRDAAPTPAPWSEAESEWSAAMSFAEGVPGFLKASFGVLDREIERLRTVAVGGTCDQNIDAAMKEQK